ncbi:MAG: glycosyltransferase family 2 protein [Chloroflexota bacterium]
MKQDASVVICAYTDKRWQDTLDAVESVMNQSYEALEVVLVIDHNPELYQRFADVYQDNDKVVVVENDSVQGLSGARNTGIRIAQGQLIGFLDDDATADSEWLGRLVAHCADDDVIGAGGKVLPEWQGDFPAWFPAEFYWVVGCTYRGIEDTVHEVRNPFGGCMVVKREAFEVFHGFRSGTGRVGDVPLGCEETEWCIRVRQTWKNRKFLYEPTATINHRIPANRTTWDYFYSRCYNEGISKALLSNLLGAQDSLSSERSYVTVYLTSGVLFGLRDAIFKLDFDGLRRSYAIITGLATTGFGYLRGLMRISQESAQADTSVDVVLPRIASTDEETPKRDLAEQPVQS